MDMGVDCLGTELAQVVVETKTEGNILLHKENGILNKDSDIKFGSHGTEEIGKKDVNDLPDNSIPVDAVDEWPAPKLIHTFYMVKYRSYDDQKTKGLLDQADKELRNINQARSQIFEKLRAKRADRAQVISQLKAFVDENKQFRQIIDEKRKEIEPLHQALGQLRKSNSGDKERIYICSSEEELNRVIKSLRYRMEHESIPLTEEKQIMREIKELEGTREKVIANAVVTAKIRDSVGEKGAIQDQVKLIGSGLDGVRKEKKVVETKLNQLFEEKETIGKMIVDLEKELEINLEDREKAYEKIRELRKQLDEGNAPYFQNRTTLNKARELAAKKDVKGLRDFADKEMETFMSRWSSTKAFSDDYERRIVLSLDMRQLSRDGRMRNPNEKPLVEKEPPPPVESEIVAKPHLKKLKEDSNTSINQKEKTVKQQNETSKAPDPASTVVASVVKDEFEMVEKEPLPVKNRVEKDLLTSKNKFDEVDEAKLKELKREEEIAKAKQAQERKKKLAEKAAAKAAIKAQKEAEKKQKDREKKEKKKAAASVSVATADMVDETETADEVVKAKAVPKTKERKEKTVVKQRGGVRVKGPDSLPKIILKRKKATNYWVCAAVLAAILVVLLSVMGYYYLM
ncbi:proton pump-interactor 1-like [Apium graveolens]|uniref:proton pump-interactor 1-like n=1 Tax=Apium graveolens TaxID=4045 RepID=UPI003D78FDE5